MNKKRVVTSKYIGMGLSEDEEYETDTPIEDIIDSIKEMLIGDMKEEYPATVTIKGKTVEYISGDDTVTLFYKKYDENTTTN